MSNTADKEAQLTDDTLAGMSDEEFANLDLSFLDEEEEDAADDVNEENSASEETGDEEASDSTEDDDSESTDADDEDDTDTAESADDAEDDTAESDTDEADSDTEDAGDTQETADKETPAEVDYKAEYEKLMAPFKANGKDMQVSTAEEVRQLMQMGANYNKKMAALKPNLKTLKVLENNKLLDPEKLGYLIDLSKKDPEAIKKLVKESGIDPLDFDNESESEYKPRTYTVDDRELDLDAVLDKIQDTPTYSKTIGLVSNKWDGPSKQAVAENPQLLEVINDHMSSGVYDRISTEVEKQQMLGRLDGLSNLEAYRTVGDDLNAKGAFNDLFPQEQAPREPQRKTVVKRPKPEDAKRTSKKRAASSTRPGASATGSKADFNPLALSDEEFEKLGNTKLM